MKSQQQLREASGYAQRPKDFDALLNILDSQVRLITPTEPDQSAGQMEEPFESSLPLAGVSDAVAAGEGEPVKEATNRESSRYYQLTHDFLVPSIRQWLTQKQQETRRGRAELRLAERSALWNAKPENRHLPSLAEWIRIRTLTDKSKWNGPQLNMMKRAGQVIGFRSTLVASIATVLIVAGMVIRANVTEARNEQRAIDLVSRLVDAEVSQVPGILQELTEYRTWADPKLRTELEQHDPISRSRLNVSLALLASDSNQLEFLKQRLLNAHPREVGTIASILEGSKADLIDDLWKVVEDTKSDHSEQRLQAASALAMYDPNNDQAWIAVAPAITDLLVNENSLRLTIWIDLLEPLRQYLVPQLGSVFRASLEDRSQSEIDSATDVLEIYAADDLKQLSELVLDAEPKQFAALFDELQAHGDAAIAKLGGEVNRELTPQWNDLPLDPAWMEPAAKLVQRIEASSGMIAERFAFCQALPLREFQDIADQLSKSGYRPIRLRPYAHGGTVLAAAAWTRDGRNWRVESAESSDSIVDKDETHRRDGYVAVDAAGYLTEQVGEPSERYSGLWVEKQRSKEDARLYVGIPYEQYREANGKLGDQGFEYHHSLQGFRSLDGTQLYCGVKTNAMNRGGWARSLWIEEFEQKVYPHNIHWDVDFIRAADRVTTKQRYEKALADAEVKIQDNSEDPIARSARGEAFYYLGQNQQALNDFEYVINHAPGTISSYFYRSILFARLGDAEAARADVQHLADRMSEIAKAHLNVVVSSFLDDEADAIKRLESLVEGIQDDGGAVYNAACAYSVAAGVFADRDVTKAKLYTDRAVALLKLAIQAGYSKFSRIQADALLDPIRGHNGFIELLKAAKVDLRCATVWNESTEFESKESHGLTSAEHLEQCRLFQADGFRIVAISTISIDGELVTASVWHRPLVNRAEQLSLARRKANAAAALARLSQHDKLLPALRITDDPESLTQFVHRCQEEGVTPVQLLSCLNLAERNRLILGGEALRIENRVLYGLLLALGEFDLAQLPVDSRQATVDLLGQWYEQDPSSTIHGVCGWLLRQWGQADRVQQVDQTERPYDPNREWFTLKIEVDSETFYQTYVVIPPGEYTIGSPAFERGRVPGEALHRVRLTTPIAILNREIIRREFELSNIVQLLNIEDQAPTGGHPMVALTWYESILYCRWLTQQIGFTESDQVYPAPSELSEIRYPRDNNPRWVKNWPMKRGARGFRLPTEAEWEIATRAGMQTRFSFGDDETHLEHYGWYNENSGRQTQVGKRLRPNVRGLFDVHGNLWEWCYGWRGEYNVGSIRIDPVGSPSGSLRVTRGGTWANTAAGCRTAARNGTFPASRGSNGGLRLALVPFVPAKPVVELASEGSEGASGAATGGEQNARRQLEGE